MTRLSDGMEAMAGLPPPLDPTLLRGERMGDQFFSCTIN